MFQFVPIARDRPAQSGMSHVDHQSQRGSRFAGSLVSTEHGSIMGFFGFSRNDSLRNRQNFTEIDPRTPIANGLVWRAGRNRWGWGQTAHGGGRDGSSKDARAREGPRLTQQRPMHRLTGLRRLYGRAAPPTTGEGRHCLSDGTYSIGHREVPT